MAEIQVYDRPEELVEHLAPCEECGGMVSLDSLITVRLDDQREGTDEMTQMPEWKARELLDELGLPRPPVICTAHGGIGVIVTEALNG